MNPSRYNSYAKALVELIGEDKALLSSYAEALKEVKDDFANNPTLHSALCSHSLPKESQFAIIDKIYGSTELTHLCPFMKMLASRHLFTNFDDIEASFRKASNEILGKDEGILYSATPLSKKEIEALEKKMEERLGKKVELDNRVEPSLIGGVRIFIDDKVYDDSVDTKIEKLRERLLKIAKGGNTHENGN